MDHWLDNSPGLTVFVVKQVGSSKKTLSGSRRIEGSIKSWPVAGVSRVAGVRALISQQ